MVRNQLICTNNIDKLIHVYTLVIYPRRIYGNVEYSTNGEPFISYLSIAEVTLLMQSDVSKLQRLIHPRTFSLVQVLHRISNLIFRVIA